MMKELSLNAKGQAARYLRSIAAQVMPLPFEPSVKGRCAITEGGEQKRQSA
jgi:hypothetical protein